MIRYLLFPAGPCKNIESQDDLLKAADELRFFETSGPCKTVDRVELKGVAWRGSDGGQ